MEAPSWLTKGEVGRLGLTKEDLPSNEKPKTVKRPETSIKDFTGGLNPEQAEILGSHAIENVKWNLRSKPYGVQAYALLQCGDSRGFGFFLEQGLGKTKTTLADFWNRYNSGFNDCMVVVTVNSMKATWRREMEDENYPFDIHVWPEFKSLPSNTQGQVVVINYEALFRRGGKMLFEWIRRGRPYLAFDESTGLMDHTTRQSKSGVNLAGLATATRCLAGKPNPMGPHNLWSQLKVIGCNVGNFYAFRNTYCVIGGYMNRTVTGQKNVDRLVATMKGKTFFADKKTWASTLPEKRYSSLECPMSAKQKTAYTTMAKELYAELIDGTTVEIDRKLHKSTKLQQISGGFLYDENRETRWLEKGEPAKLRLVKDFIANATGKTIIFALFKPTVKMLIEAFPGAPFALSKLEMPSEQLEANKARFNSDDCDLPFIASSSVLKYGHTLVGTPTNPCQNVLFVENSYSLLTRAQAEDRAHRWGATADCVTYYDIICSPVDRKLIGALKRRDNLSMALLEALKGVVDG